MQRRAKDTDDPKASPDAKKLYTDEEAAQARSQVAKSPENELLSCDALLRQPPFARTLFQDEGLGSYIQLQP
jgi:hypothetical protein